MIRRRLFIGRAFWQIHVVADDPLEVYDFNNVSWNSEYAYETRVVQVAIQKFTALLWVGFGVAGAEIISKDMAVGE